MTASLNKGPRAEDIAVGARIRATRLSLGITQEGLAGAIGVTFQHVQKYEKGTNRVGASRMIQIAGVLKTTVATLFGENDHAEVLGAKIMSTAHGQRIVAAFDKIEDANDRILLANLAESLARKVAS